MWPNLGIAADWFLERSRLHHASQRLESLEERRGGRRDRELPPQGRVELVQQGARRDNAAHANDAVNHLSTKPLGYQRRDEDVGIENDGHETMLNTSSSV